MPTKKEQRPPNNKKGEGHDFPSCPWVTKPTRFSARGELFRYATFFNTEAARPCMGFNPFESTLPKLTEKPGTHADTRTIRCDTNPCSRTSAPNQSSASQLSLTARAPGPRGSPHARFLRKTSRRRFLLLAPTAVPCLSRREYVPRAPGPPASDPRAEAYTQFQCLRYRARPASLPTAPPTRPVQPPRSLPLDCVAAAPWPRRATKPPCRRSART